MCSSKMQFSPFLFCHLRTFFSTLGGSNHVDVFDLVFRVGFLFFFYTITIFEGLTFEILLLCFRPCNSAHFFMEIITYAKEIFYVIVIFDIRMVVFFTAISFEGNIFQRFSTIFNER